MHFPINISYLVFSVSLVLPRELKPSTDILWGHYRNTPAYFSQYRVQTEFAVGVFECTQSSLLFSPANTFGCYSNCTNEV